MKRRSLKEVFRESYTDGSDHDLDMEDWANDIFNSMLFHRDSDQETFDKLNELFNDESGMPQGQFKKVLHRAAKRQIDAVAEMLKSTIDSLGLED